MSYTPSIFRKKHKYETKEDLKGMNWEDIVRYVNTKDVGFYIEKTKGTLNTQQELALHFILNLKRIQKNNPTIDIEKYKESYIAKKKGVEDPSVSKVMNEVLSDPSVIPNPAVRDYYTKNELPSVPVRKGGKQKTKTRGRGNKKRRSKRKRIGLTKKIRSSKRVGVSKKR